MGTFWTAYDRGFQDGYTQAKLIGLSLPQWEQGGYYLGAEDGRTMLKDGYVSWPLAT